MDSAATRGGIAKWVEQLGRRHPELIVMEAVGGWEEGLMTTMMIDVSLA
jgi:hypothetical protein